MIVSEKKIKISSPAEIAFNATKIINEPLQEHFLIFGLNNKNVVQYIDLASLGTVSETIVHPREIFRESIKRSCSAIIVAHNHPSGVLTPSREDITTTRRLVDAGKLLGVPVLDHVIIGDGFLSMKEEGYINV